MDRRGSPARVRQAGRGGGVGAASKHGAGEHAGDEGATGVAFTRDPSTGDNDFYGEYLINAQGEDVVAGIRTPQPLTVHSRHKNETDLPSMEETMPDVYRQLCDVRAKLESHYRDMQDIEFTVQRGTLYMLQTRNGKRTAKAALKIAVDMVKDELITKEEAVQRVSPSSLDQLLHPTLDPEAERDVVSRGLPASPGAASGKIVFTADEAERRARSLLDTAKSQGIHSGKSPVGLAAAAVYAASLLVNEKVTQSEVSDVANISEVTIRNRYHELLEAEDGVALN